MAGGLQIEGGFRFKPTITRRIPVLTGGFTPLQMFSLGNVSHLAVSFWVCYNGFIFQVKSISMSEVFISMFNFKFLNVLAILFYGRA